MNTICAVEADGNLWVILHAADARVAIGYIGSDGSIVPERIVPELLSASGRLSGREKQDQLRALDSRCRELNPWIFTSSSRGGTTSWRNIAHFYSYSRKKDVPCCKE